MLGVLFMFIYPLNETKMKEIGNGLSELRDKKIPD